MKTLSKPNVSSTELTNIQLIHGLLLKDITPLEPIKKTSKRRVQQSLLTPEAEGSMLPPIDGVQVFSAKINAFGRKSIPVDAVVLENKRSVVLDLAKDNFTFDQSSSLTLSTIAQP